MCDRPQAIPFKTGMRKRPFRNNVVSIGLSGGFIEPLELSALHLNRRSAGLTGSPV